MPSKHNKPAKLPGRFDELVRCFPPRAIADDAHHEATVEMIDRLMTTGKLTRGQESYLETLVQLVQAFEASRHAIEPAGGIETLRHILAENGMNASDLARLLGVHASMGSKILNGDRSLTLDHVQRLADHFGVRPDAFIGQTRGSPTRRAS